MLVNDFLENSAERSPDKIALICQDRRLTYGEIETLANRFARALVAQGVGRGDRVAIILDNSPEAAVAIFAVLKANAVFSVINPTTKAEKLAYVLENSGARAAICDRAHWQAVAATARRSQALRLLICLPEPPSDPDLSGFRVLGLNEIVAGFPDTAPHRQCIDVDLATIIYTSGSTGFPKGVMSTHLNIVTAATSITTYLENTADDIILNVLPLSFDYGLYQLLMAFRVGGTLVLEKSFVFPYRVVDLICREQVTGFPGVPTIFAILLQLKDLQKLLLPSLRYITNTAAALSVSHVQRLREAFPHVRIYSMYGLTECKRVSYLPPEEIDSRPDSVGKAIPNTEVYVVDDAGSRLPPGSAGELVVRGAHVTRGYWGDPEATAQAFRPGPLPGETVLYTGDFFRMDEEGFLYFMGRKDDFIKSRGEKISPKEIENALYSLEDIAEAAVIGVPDPVLGMAIKAVIAPRNGAQIGEREVIAHCARHLEDFMVPKIVEIRPVLPKTATGKIDKKELR